MALFPFASCVPFSNNTPLAQAEQQRSGVLFRATAHDAPPDSVLERIEVLLGLGGSDTMRYADRKKGQRRTVRMEHAPGTEANSSRLEAFLLAGDTSAQAWIRTLLQDELPAQTYGRALLIPGAKAPVAVQARGKQVCSCFNVCESAIRAQLARCTGSPDERLAALQGSLQCGTNCGSCVPELKNLVRATIPAGLAA